MSWFSNRDVDKILTAVNGLHHHLHNMEARIMSAISDAVSTISGKVAAQATVIDSVEALTSGLSQQIKDLAAQLAGSADVPAAVDALNALSAAVDAKTAELSANVVANTPSAPSTPPAA